MSEFYARAQGGRSEATRTGTSGSGIRATVETWSSVIRSSFRMSDGDHMASIEVTDKSGNQTGLRFDIDADGLARFARGGGVNGEYGGDDVETTATLDELREQVTTRLARLRDTADEINALLDREANL
jgi:hypothetical protein